VDRTPSARVRRARPGPLHAAAPAAEAGFHARPWGGYQVLEEGREYKVKRLVVQPGHRLSLQRHRRRAEHWVVVAGAPRVVVGARTLRLRPRGTVDVPRGAWHRIENPGKAPVVIIEVQTGDYLGEDDIVRRQDDYGRAGAASAPGRRRA
jgi:mannose-6-phosphate isomerase-like protein (cupin superfamily)